MMNEKLNEKSRLSPFILEGEKFCSRDVRQPVAYLLFYAKRFARTNAPCVNKGAWLVSNKKSPVIQRRAFLWG